MTTSTFKILVSDLSTEFSSRLLGAKAREKLDAALLSHDLVELDFLFSNVTPSFADECIGVIAGRLGFAEFKRRVKMSNMLDSNKPLIKHVIIRRCNSRADA